MNEIMEWVERQLKRITLAFSVCFCLRNLVSCQLSRVSLACNLITLCARKEKIILNMRQDCFIQNINKTANPKVLSSIIYNATTL